MPQACEVGMTDGFKVRDRRDAGWFWITNNIILDYGPKVGAYGIAVYAVLAQCSRDDHSKTTLRQLSSLLGISPQTAMRAVEKLIEFKLIRETKKSLSPAQGPSEYDLLSVPIGNGVIESVPIGNPAVPVGNRSVPIGNTNKTIKTEDYKENTSLFSEEPTNTQKSKESDRGKGKSKSSAPWVHPDWFTPAIRQSWDAWLEMRKAKRVPATAHALDLAVGALEKFGIRDAKAILDRSTMNGWQGLFALPKDQESNTGRPPDVEKEDAVDRMQRKEREWREKRARGEL